MSHEQATCWTMMRDTIERSIGYQPGHAAAYYDLGVTLEALDDIAGSRAVFDQAITLDPQIEKGPRANRRPARDGLSVGE